MLNYKLKIQFSSYEITNNFFPVLCCFCVLNIIYFTGSRRKTSKFPFQPKQLFENDYQNRHHPKICTLILYPPRLTNTSTLSLEIRGRSIILRKHHLYPLEDKVSSFQFRNYNFIVFLAAPDKRSVSLTSDAPLTIPKRCSKVVDPPINNTQSPNDVSYNHLEMHNSTHHDLRDSGISLPDSSLLNNFNSLAYEAHDIRFDLTNEQNFFYGPNTNIKKEEVDNPPPIPPKSHLSMHQYNIDTSSILQQSSNNSTMVQDGLNSDYLVPPHQPQEEDDGNKPDNVE